MNGFQNHFSNLYNDTSGQDEAVHLDSVVNQTTECNDTTLQFCETPDTDDSRTCGSGSGADSASLIVSAACSYYNLLLGYKANFYFIFF